MHVLRSSRAIRSVLGARNAGYGRSMSVHARGVEVGGGQAAVVAGRSMGGAVRRNRAKRRLRAVLGRVGIPNHLQVVVVARPAACDVAFSTLEEEFVRLLRRVAPPGARTRVES